MLSSESEDPEWKALLTEVLAAIAKRLTSVTDYSSFRGVCTSWRCAATFHNFDRDFPRAPRLLYFLKETEEETPVLDDWKREETPVLGDALSEVSEETPVLDDWKREETPVLGDALSEVSEETRDALSEVSEEGEEEETPVLGDALSEVSEETRDALSEVSEETRDALSDVSEETLVHGKIVTKFLDLESNTSKIVNFPPPTFCPYKYLSCSGWILVWNETEVSNKIEFMNEFEFSLKHFMLGISIKLPLLNVFISKMVLSGSPMESGLVVMVIWGYDDQLAFCRPGDECWTLMDPWGGFFYDIIYHDRKLYALDSSLSIVECDIHGPNPTKIVKVFAIPPYGFFKDRGVIQKFLVESFGKFLLVLQYMSNHFRIYEIELKKDGSCSYEEIDNMGDRCLFLGFNSSICVASSSVGLKPNCIYFSKSKPRIWEPYVGVYTLGSDGDGHFQDFSAMFDFCFPPPVWVVPTI